jgi:hypothetical protein
MRPGLGAWLTDPTLSSQWDVLVAAKMDRITRSVADLCNLIEFCDKRAAKSSYLYPSPLTYLLPLAGWSRTFSLAWRSSSENGSASAGPRRL